MRPRTKTYQARILIATLAAVALAAPVAYAGESGGHSSGGPAYGIPVTQAPGDAIHTEIAGRAGKLGPGRYLPGESLQLARALRITSPASQTGGFDWADAGVGAGIGVAAVLLAAAGARLRGHRFAHS